MDYDNIDWLIKSFIRLFVFVCLFLSLFFFFFYLIRIDLYLSLRVHLLPGFPKNASGTLLVALYVQQPLGLFIGNQSVLPSSALVEIIQLYERQIEAAIGANITGVEALFKPTSSAPTEIPVGPTSSSDETVWIVIGVLGGLVLLLLIILIVMLVHRR